MRALAVATLLWGVTAAAQAAPLPTTVVTTEVLTGSANDMVEASIDDVGVPSTGQAVPVTLRILGEGDVVLATVTGTVSTGSPLRVRARAPSAAGVRAQLILHPSRVRMAAGVLTLEREAPRDPPRKTVCVAAKDPNTTMPEPITMYCWVEVEE
ncbi:MAG: hypothetical protein EOO71_00170 [Myxococcaceae bacterium]|nr:MAG: hypothetical protein EOO71_00170 [Myxococcaceae bacterium]